MKSSRFTSLSMSSILAATILTTPLTTQAVELVEQVGDFQITRVASSKVCFAVLNTKSAKDAAVTYATFKTTSGDRWQVVGFVKDEDIKVKGDLLSIRFDDEHLMARGVEFSKGDFALPFTETNELQVFDKNVAEKASMELQLKQLDDAISVPLDQLRKARAAVDNCLKEIN